MTLRPYSQTLQQAYRDTLGTPGAPEAIDDSQPVMPVAVVAQVNTATTSSFTRITDGTDTALVTTAGELNTAPKESALSKLSGTNISLAAPTTLGTVPANRRWRVYAYQLSGDTDAGGGIETARLTVGGVQIASVWCAASQTYFVALNLYPNYHAATAGQTVTLLSADTGSTCAATVHYIEEVV